MNLPQLYKKLRDVEYWEIIAVVNGEATTKKKQYPTCVIIISYTDAKGEKCIVRGTFSEFQKFTTGIKLRERLWIHRQFTGQG